MKKLLPILLVLSACGPIDGPIPEPTEKIEKPEVLMIQPLDPKTHAHALSLGFKDTYIVYEWTIDRNNNGIFDCIGEELPQQCEDFLTTVPKDKEIVFTIDWEGQTIERVGRGEQEAIEQYLIALDYFRKALPLAKIGFYGIPYTTYWTRNKDVWMQIAKNQSQVLQAVDLYMPSLYDFYKNDPEADTEFVKRNVEWILDLPPKEIYLYVWHRYHAGGQSEAYATIIPAPEFNNFVNSAFAVSVNGRRMKGLIWWGVDTFNGQPNVWEDPVIYEKLMYDACGSQKDMWAACMQNTLRFIVDEQINKIQYPKEKK